MEDVQIKGHLTQLNCATIMERFTKTSLDVNKGKKTIK